MNEGTGGKGKHESNVMSLALVWLWCLQRSEVLKKERMGG